MGGHAANDYWEDWGLVLLWTSMLAGPVAWGLNLQVGYALVKWACRTQQILPLVLVAAATFALAIWGAWLGWRCLRTSRDGASPEGGGYADRSAFMARVAIGLNVLFALLIATSAFPAAVLSPCE